MLLPGESGARVGTSVSIPSRRKCAADGLFAISLGEIIGSCLFEPDSQSRAQPVELGLFPFEKPKAGSQGFADVLVASGGDQPIDQIGLCVRQYHVSSCHAGSPFPN